MKIAVPVENGRVSPHFGHCSAFELYDVDEAAKRPRSRTTLPAPPHEPGLLPRWLNERGADYVIAGGMGQRARRLFAEHGIHVVVGAPPQPVDEIVDAFLADRLRSGVNPCDH